MIKHSSNSGQQTYPQTNTPRKTSMHSTMVQLSVVQKRKTTDNQKVKKTSHQNYQNKSVYSNARSIAKHHESKTIAKSWV